MVIEPCLQIRSNSIFAYNKFPRRNVLRSFIQKQTAKNLRTQTYTGTLRPGAKKRLTKSIEFLVMLTKKPVVKISPVTKKAFNFRLSFLTLTISQSTPVTGKEAHSNLLEPFLRWMRETHGCKLYVWKAELQKRGQLHYHITSDCFIHYKQVRAKWNQLQKDAGYLDEYHEKYGKWDPPSTQIKNVRKIKNIGHYLVKEIAKSFQNEQSINGKVWDCSKTLKGKEFFTVHSDGRVMNAIDERICKGEVRYINTDFCTIYQFLEGNPEDVLQRSDLRAFNKALKEVIDPPDIKEEVYLPEYPAKVINFNVQQTLFSRN
jgi:hypothetical protein